MGERGGSKASQDKFNDIDESQHKISKNVVCATSKGSDQSLNWSLDCFMSIVYA